MLPAETGTIIIIISLSHIGQCLSAVPVCGWAWPPGAAVPQVPLCQVPAVSAGGRGGWSQEEEAVGPEESLPLLRVSQERSTQQ